MEEGSLPILVPERGHQQASQDSDCLGTQAHADQIGEQHYDREGCSTQLVSRCISAKDGPRQNVDHQERH